MNLRSLFLLLLISSVAVGQRATRYEVSFPNYIHHEASIKLFIPNAKGLTTVRMSRSSPGRYATHEFGKNVYNVKAYDSASGKSFAVDQRDGDVYNIASTTGTLVVEYTLFADHVDGTYAGIDRNHAHLNMPATFLWVIGRDATPIQVKFNIPPASNWKVATQLKRGADEYSFWAPGLQYFMDSPTEVSDFKLRSFDITDHGKKKRFALHYMEILLTM